MDDSDKLDQIGRAMQAAWQRVKKAQSRMWGDWMVIGDGLLEGRRWAMQQAGTNRPEGKGYVTAYAEWLKRYKVDDMDKSDRAKLLQLMEERPAVEEWRMTLTDYERRSLNHPLIVWRKWTAATRVKKPKPRTAGVSATEHGRAQATVEQLQGRVEELEEELTSARETAPALTVDQHFDALVEALQDVPLKTVNATVERFTMRLNEAWNRRRREGVAERAPKAKAARAATERGKVFGDIDQRAKQQGQEGTS